METYHIFIETVSYSVYEWPIVYSNQMKGEKIKSRTLDKLIENTKPIHQDIIKLPTKLDVGGVILRNFQYIIRRERDHQYAVVANADGGLLGLDGKTDSNYKFSKNEIASDTGLISICGGDATMPNKDY